MPRSAQSARESEMRPVMAEIHWKIGEKTGHGSPMDAFVAQSFVVAMNEKWGSGTHWLVFCDEVSDTKCRVT